jgi:hypothetical protein
MTSRTARFLAPAVFSAILDISLVDGLTWQCNSPRCGGRKLTPAEAWR